jgi:hypothetical protein
MFARPLNEIAHQLRVGCILWLGGEADRDSWLTALARIPLAPVLR